MDKCVYGEDVYLTGAIGPAELACTSVDVSVTVSVGTQIHMGERQIIQYSDRAVKYSLSPANNEHAAGSMGTVPCSEEMTKLEPTDPFNSATSCCARCS